jgi:hypothetical protein
MRALDLQGLFLFQHGRIGELGRCQGICQSLGMKGETMFITKQQRSCIEFNLAEGHQAPTLVHCFSDRADPFKTVLPQLIKGAGLNEERVFVVESPLSDIVDETIWLLSIPEFTNSVVINVEHRAFFAAVRLSLEQGIAKIDQIKFAVIDEDEADTML